MVQKQRSCSIDKKLILELSSVIIKMKALVIALLVSLVAIVNCLTDDQQRCIAAFRTNVNNTDVVTAVDEACRDLVRNNECANNVLSKKILLSYSHQVLSCDRCALTCQETASDPCNHFIRHVMSTRLMVSPTHAPKCMQHNPAAATNWSH